MNYAVSAATSTHEGVLSQPASTKLAPFSAVSVNLQMHAYYTYSVL